MRRLIILTLVLSTLLLSGCVSDNSEHIAINENLKTVIQNQEITNNNINNLNENLKIVNENLKIINNNCK